MRGFVSLSANFSTRKPAGTRGVAPAGCGIRRGWFRTDSVANGAGKSAVVNLRRTPGASVVQSPIAASPVNNSLPARRGASACGVGVARLFACPPAVCSFAALLPPTHAPAKATAATTRHAANHEGARRTRVEFR
jgi:hypothetical protein